MPPKRAKKRSSDGPGYESKALFKGVEILDVLARSDHPIPLRDLCQLIHLSKTSTFRLLRSLEALGYLARDSGDAYYLEIPWLPPRQLLVMRALRELAVPALTALNQQTGETASLAFLFGDHIRVIHVVESRHYIRMSNFPFRILPPYASSLGKAIAAFQPSKRMQRLLDTYGIHALTSNTLTEPQAILREFETVRKEGYSKDMQESVPGGVCFGAPIEIPGEGVLASLSVSLPIVRLTEELQQALPRMVRETAKQIQAAYSRTHGTKAVGSAS